jgi:replicative DNA helicase
MTDPVILDPAEIQARIAAMRGGEVVGHRNGVPFVVDENLPNDYSGHQYVIGTAEGGSTPSDPWPYRLIHPLSAAADGLIEYIQNPEGRFMLGLTEIDAMTRGFGRGELILVTGRPHSGKTQVVLHSITENAPSRILYFSFDEPDLLVLTKLVGMTHGIDAELLEARIKAHDPQIVDLVRRTATETYPNLIIVDESLSFPQMVEAQREAEDHWGAQCDAVIVDFLELLPSEGEGDAAVSAKAQGMKRFTKGANAPVICIHQNKRGDSKRGKPMGMEGMRFGGEAEAIMVLEVYRKREDETSDPHLRASHEDTVTVSVCKNKRPPAKKGERDYFMNPATGQLASNALLGTGGHGAPRESL